MTTAPSAGNPSPRPTTSSPPASDTEGGAPRAPAARTAHEASSAQVSGTRTTTRASEAGDDRVQAPDARTSSARGATGVVLARWWPAVTAAVAGALTVSGGADGGGVVFLLFALPVVYLAIAILDRPWTSWLMVGSVIGLHFLLEAAGLVAWPVVLGLGVVLVAVGLALGPLRRPGVFALQIPALAVFGGAGILAVVVSPEAAVAVVAVGLLAHAAWDAVHWWTRKVISRSLAEWCMVYDTAVGATILVVLLVRAF